MGPRSRSLVLPVKFMDDTSSDEAKQHPSLPASKHPMKLLSLCVYRVLLAPRRDMSIKEKMSTFISDLPRPPSAVVA